MANTRNIIKQKAQEFPELQLEKEKNDIIEFAKSRLPSGYFDWLERISQDTSPPSTLNNNYTIVTSAEGAFYAG